MTVLVVLGVGVAAWAVLEWWPALTRRPWRNTLAYDGRQKLNRAGVAFATALAVGLLWLAADAPPGWPTVLVRPVAVTLALTFLALGISSDLRRSRARSRTRVPGRAMAWKDVVDMQTRKAHAGAWRR